MSATVLALMLPGCGTDDPDTNNYPWPERPTSAPSLVPVPTPDGEATAEPDPDDASHQSDIDLIVEMLVDQKITVAGIHDLSTAPELTDGVHYQGVTSISEGAVEDSQGGYVRVTRVTGSTLASDASVEVAQTSYKVIETEDGQQYEWVDEDVYWRVSANGDRVPVTSWWYPPTLDDDEWIAETCGEHLLARQPGMSASEGSRYRIHPAGGSEPLPVSPDLLGVEEPALIVRMEVADCSDTRVILRVTTSPEGEDWYEEGEDALFSIDVLNPDGVERLDDDTLAAFSGDSIVVAEIATDRGTVRRRSSDQEDATVMTLPGTDEFVWTAMAGSEDHLAVVLRSHHTSSRLGGGIFGHDAYVIVVDVRTAQARIYRYQSDADLWFRALEIHDDVLQVTLPYGQVPQPFVISLESGSAAKAPAGNDALQVSDASEIDIKDDVIGIRVLDELIDMETEQGTWFMSSSTYTIGRLTDPSTW